MILDDATLTLFSILAFLGLAMTILAWPRGCHHLWLPFQTVAQRRCYRCGRIRNEVTGDEWASWEEYLADRRHQW